MFKLSELKSIDVQDTPEGHTQQQVHMKLRVWSYGLDCCLVLLMSIVLYWGASTQFANKFIDVYRYQCYATAFWHGTPGLAGLSQQQCSFIGATTSTDIVSRLQAHHFPTWLI